jgi:ABC-type multidrug transport system fused ATPase/permease subunit
LSAGQKHRTLSLSILYRRAEILILREATRQLNPASELANEVIRAHRE